MVSTVTVCGGTKHELIYDSGPLEPYIWSPNFDLSPLYTLPLPGSQFTGNVFDSDWVGTHKFIVRGTLGTLNTSANSRGKYGFYGSVDSDPLTITIYDRCSLTKINNDYNFPV